MSIEYGKIEENSEIMDVLFAVIIREKTPKSISKKLKVNGSVVRSKLQFLRKKRLLIKDKWDYSPDWDSIYRAMQKAFLLVLDDYEKIKKGSTRKLRKNAKEYFSKELLVSIVKVYSTIYFYGYEKLSFKEMLRSFLTQLARTERKRIRRINPKLLKVKETIERIPTKEDLLFSQFK